MIHCLTFVEVTGKIVSIHSNDTDVIVTLLGNYHKVSMKRLLMHRSTNTWLELTKVYENVGKLKETPILDFIGLRHCRKIIWEKQRYMDSLEKFVCKIYSNSKMTTLKETRWKLYVQELKKMKKTASARSKTIFEILPPTEESFMQHLRRSHVQTKIFAEADKANIEKIDPAQYGWKMLDNHAAPKQQ